MVSDTEMPFLAKRLADTLEKDNSSGAGIDNSCLAMLVGCLRGIQERKYAECTLGLLCNLAIRILDEDVVISPDVCQKLTGDLIPSLSLQFSPKSLGRMDKFN